MDWLKQNGISIIIALVTLVSSYAVAGYRITSLENSLADQKQEIAQLRNGDISTRIALATIQKDIEYIKVQLSQIAKQVD